MNEQDAKLELVKKRCNTANTVVNVLRIITAVGAVIALLSGLILLANADAINPHLAKSIQDGSLTIDNTIEYDGLFHFFMDLDDVSEPGNYALPLGITLIVAAVSCILVTVVLTIIKRIFTCIRQENNPFSDNCLKQLKTSFIVIAITVLLSSSSLGAAAVTAVILWCIYSIFEYGAAIQTQVVETL